MADVLLLCNRIITIFIVTSCIENGAICLVHVFDKKLINIKKRDSTQVDTLIALIHIDM